MAQTSTPKIPMTEIKKFIKICKSERDDSQRCRQIISQLLNERNEFADKLLGSCIIPIGDTIKTRHGQVIHFKDSEAYDGVVGVTQEDTDNIDKMELHYWRNGVYDGNDLPEKCEDEPVTQAQAHSTESESSSTVCHNAPSPPQPQIPESTDGEAV